MLEHAAIGARNRADDGVPEGRLDAPIKTFPAFRSSTVIVTIWCVLSVAVGRILTALNPGLRDSQLFAYIGQQWLRGRIPYLDTWENKPPGVFAISAASLSVLTRDFKSIEVIEGLFIIGTAFATRALLRVWKAPPIVANFAMAAVAIGLSLQSLNEGGNLTETYLTLPAVLSMLAFACGETRNSAWYILAAGLGSGFAALFKPVGLAPLLAQLTYLAYGAVIRRRIAIPAAIRAALVNILGVFLAWIPALLYFRAHGAAGEMLNASFFYNVGYAATGLPHHLFSRPLWIIPKFEPMSVVLILAVLGLFHLPNWSGKAHYLPKVSEGHWMLAAVWALFDAGGAIAAGHGYAHYLLPLVLSLSVTSSFTLWAVLCRLQVYQDRSLAWTFVLLVFLSLGFAQIRDVGARTRALRARQLETAELLAGQLKQTASRDDTLFVWPYEPAIFFATGLPSPSRFETGAYIFYTANAHRRIGTEILTALQQRPPSYIVDAVVPPTAVAGDPFYLQFRAFLAAHYGTVQRVGDLQLFRYDAKANSIP